MHNPTFVQIWLPDVCEVGGLKGDTYPFPLIGDESGDLCRMLGLLDTIPLPGKRSVWRCTWSSSLVARTHN